MNDAELGAMNPHFMLDELTIDRLQQWVTRYYRDRVRPDDLRDPQFMQDCFSALEALTELLDLGNFYPFQN
jgi:succinylarginine dihydrolase